MIKLLVLTRERRMMMMVVVPVGWRERWLYM